MSTAIVNITRVEQVLPHPNADNLEIARLENLGYQVVVRKGTYEPGDVLVYFPPDVTLPEDWAEELGVTTYLQWREVNGVKRGRVRSIKLRGEPSFGFTSTIPGHLWEWVMGHDDADSLTFPFLGYNVAEFYDAVKWEPPVNAQRVLPTDAVARPGTVPKYTDIENMRQFPDVFTTLDTVVITEKIHGTCTQVGFAIDLDAPGGYSYYAGCGKGLLRKKPENEDELQRHWYWHTFALPGVRGLLDYLREDRGQSQVFLFGETYGPVQKLTYGTPNKLGFRVFDIMCNGQYLSWVTVRNLCDGFGIETVPELYVGPFSLEVVKSLAGGPSTVPGANHIREGVVVKTLSENTTHPKIGRTILKWVSDDYLTGKWSAEEAGEV